MRLDQRFVNVFTLLPEPQQQHQEVSLSLAEWKLVASLAADIPLRELAQKLGLGEFNVRQVAYRLIRAGLAEVAEPEIAPPPRFEMPVEVEQPRAGGLSRLFGRR